MAMNNSLAEVHPELISEWSEKNLPLKPDEVNAKSRKNVWWRCSKCGNEWKSVINARVKGTVCPVCAEREVLAGYNDLATTDNQLLIEWDYEKNRFQPTEVSKPSHDQTIRMRKFFEEGKLTTEVIQAIMSEEKPNQKEKITLSMDRVEKFIPKNIKISQREDFICKALEHYNKYLRQRADRDSR